MLDERVVRILAERTSYRNGMNISNLYCTCVVGLLGLQVTALVQASGGAGLDATIVQRVKAPYSYASSDKLDWIQSTMGSSGWSREGPTAFSADPNILPFMGSIFSALVLAFLCICVLLGVYMCFVSVPEGASTYVFLEPRGLIVINGFITLGSSYCVDSIFARYDVVFGRALTLIVFQRNQLRMPGDSPLEAAASAYSFALIHLLFCAQVQRRCPLRHAGIRLFLPVCMLAGLCALVGDAFGEKGGW